MVATNGRLTREDRSPNRSGFLVHDETVILTGFGEHHLVLTPQAAERLASRLSGAAFTAACAPSQVVEDSAPRTGWTQAAPVRQEQVEHASFAERD